MSLQAIFPAPDAGRYAKQSPVEKNKLLRTWIAAPPKEQGRAHFSVSTPLAYLCKTLDSRV